MNVVNTTDDDEIAMSNATNSTTGLAPTYAGIETSRAYQSGLLKSDFNISSNHPSIRVAFRYVVVGDEAERNDNSAGKNGSSEDDDAIYLCWIGQDGSPHHFYSINSVRRRQVSSAETKSSNLRKRKAARDTNQTNSNTADYDIMNENDHVETTKPGHAFVFCRRIEYDSSFAQGGVATAVDEDDSYEEESTNVVNFNGVTVFLRRQQSKTDSNNNKTESDDKWEAFLIVGGYRPGLMESSSEEVSSEESDGEDSSSDEDDDGDETKIQLVTLKCFQNKQLKTDDGDDDDDDPGPKMVDCSSCLQLIPFLRGALGPKLQHTHAFVSMHNTASRDNEYEVTVCMTQLDPTPIDTSSKHYDVVFLGGWPCRVEPGCFPDDEEGIALRARFEADLLAASLCLPPSACAKLKKSTPIWFNKSQQFGPKAAPIRGRDLCFHPGSRWLVRNGMNAAKQGGVEVYDVKHYLSDCDLWGPGGLFLHELSHAWHYLHTENAYDNAPIKECYDKAMEEDLYKCVEVHGPQGPKCKAYACQDQMEYFAELSVAFLGGLDDEKEHNKWFPFNRKQLKEHDPRAFDMLHKMWKLDEEKGRWGRMSSWFRTNGD